MKLISRVILVLASMMLPNAVLATIAIAKHQYLLATPFMLLAVLGFASNALAIGKLHSVDGAQLECVVQIKRFGFDTFSHILSYVPSLVAFSIDLSSGGVALIIFYLLYLLLLAASDMVVLNPFLHLLGWRFQSAALKFDAGTEEIVVIVPPKQELTLGNQKLVSVALFGMYLLRE